MLLKNVANFDKFNHMHYDAYRAGLTIRGGAYQRKAGALLSYA